MQNREEVLNTAILTRLSYFHLNTMVELYRKLGSATAIIEQRHDLGKMFRGLPQRILEDLASIDVMKPRAEEELSGRGSRHTHAMPQR